MRRSLRFLLIALAVLLAAAFAAAWWVRGEMRGSLAQLDGERQLEGLSAPVRVSRDSLGIPTIRGENRADVARATGFLHAQDRFFQMDLARRRAAGELAALVGPRALVIDREIRIHRFRAEARQAVALLSPEEGNLLRAYAAGVNSGLDALDAAPFEYLLLRRDPEPWRPEDSLLVVLSMFVTLQDTDGSYESTLGTMHEVLPQAMFDFLAPRGSEWDAPVVGAAFAMPPIPGPGVYDLRSKRTSRTTPNSQSPTPNSQRPRTDDQSRWGIGDWELGVGGDRELGVDAVAALGSNSFAVAGRLTSNGSALLANDMHLGIRVPNTWYRAALEWPDPSNPSEPHRLYGITLPGVPALVVGSNTHIAWGFTNTYADWSDVVILETDPSSPGRYKTPDGWREFERHQEVFSIAGQPDERQEILWTIWGPVIAPDHRGRMRAYRWVAHSAERLASATVPLERARTIEEAFEEANGVGTPGQNIVIADRGGRIGWSVYGTIPRRAGLDGRVPASWSDGARGWNGWLDDSEYPRILDPAAGRLWTANNRVVDGDGLARLGDGSYEIGSRASIIRDRLQAKEQFAAGDLLAIQLDTSARFLARWRDVILKTLTPEAVAGSPQRAAFRDVVERGWTGQVTADSAAYRLTRTFREMVSERVIDFVLVECYQADPDFDYTQIRTRDAAIHTLVTEQPQHLLDPEYASWTALLVGGVDAAIERATRDESGDLSERAWAEYNPTAYRHPLSGALPFIWRWLDMPSQELPGDLYTPRVHWGAIGASERMVVSPGREAEGIMHMPTGQSGHPLSPFYANSHPSWIRGEPTPFLPGKAEHDLVLSP